MAEKLPEELLNKLMMTYENSHGEIVALTTVSHNEVIRRCQAYDGLVEVLEAAQLMLLQTNWNGENAMNIVNNTLTAEQAPKEASDD